MICIGFAGCEAFDIILYMSRTLIKLNYRILVIDISETGALTKAIYHGMDLDSRQEIVNYRNINYLRRMPSEEELSSFVEGVIMIDFGIQSFPDLSLPCNFLYTTTNTFPYIIDNINTLMLNSEWKTEKQRLIIRDMITPDDIDRVASKIRFHYDAIESLYLDIDDYYCAVNCQEIQLIRFMKLSSGMKTFIISQLHDIFPQIKIKRIKNAFALAGKGR